MDTTEPSAAPPAPVAENKSASVELFELCTALLLGLGATLGSIASYEGGLWSGISIEKYGASARKTTDAADESAYADSKMGLDAQIKLAAIQILARARNEKDEKERNTLLDEVSELYIRELTTEAYNCLELPEEARIKYNKDRRLMAISEKELFHAVDLDFDKEYYSAMYADSKKIYSEAHALFEEGREANEAGDEFALAGVYYTMSLFFGGLGLVFKTRVRWIFFILGSGVLVGASVFLARLEWV